MALLAAIAIAGGSIYWWKHRPQKQTGMQGAPPEFVDITAAKSETWQPTGRLVGTVVPKRSVNLANEIVGVVTEVGFESGATVEPGQVLLRLDAATELADLASAEAAQRLAAAAIEVAQADINTAQTNVEWGIANYERYKGAPPKAVSESDVDKARTDLDKAQSALKRQQSVMAQMRAEHDQAKARVDQIKAVIAKKTLKAPFRAITGMRNIHPGQYIAEGTTIVLLNELSDDIYLDFAIPQEYTPLVYPGTTVTATSNILGRGKANTVQISVLSMDATVNPVTRNIRVRTQVPNKDHVLKPGMFVDVEVPIGPARPVVTVPTTAVRRAAFGDHVFVLESPPPAAAPTGGAPPPGDSASPQMPSPRIARQRMVTLGTNLGDRVIVNSGIREGESVATAGSFKLHEGATVFPAPPPPPTTPAGNGTEPKPTSTSSR